MAVRTHPLEDGRAGEDVPRRDAKLRETGFVATSGERQRRDDGVKLAQPHEPPGYPVLDRRQAGQKGRHGRGRRRGKDRGHRPARRCPERRGRAGLELRLAESVDDDEHDVAGVRDLVRSETGEVSVRTITRAGRAEPGEDRLHQVDEAAVAIVRQVHRFGVGRGRRGGESYPFRVYPPERRAVACALTPRRMRGSTPLLGVPQSRRTPTFKQTFCDSHRNEPRYTGIRLHRTCPIPCSIHCASRID